MHRFYPCPHAQATTRCACKSSAARTVPAVLLTCQAIPFKGSASGCLISPSRLRPTSGEGIIQAELLKSLPPDSLPLKGMVKQHRVLAPSGLHSPCGEVKRGHFCHPRCHWQTRRLYLASKEQHLFGPWVAGRAGGDARSSEVEAEKANSVCQPLGWREYKTPFSIKR